jgi:hypothetical protein
MNRKRRALQKEETKKGDMPLPMMPGKKEKME